MRPLGEFLTNCPNCPARSSCLPVPQSRQRFNAAGSASFWQGRAARSGIRIGHLRLSLDYLAWLLECSPTGRREARMRRRVGQEAFRARLFREQGEVCAFAGPTSADALEAAHLYSYAESGEHHEYGGLLLRSDIHRLFDLGHIAVDVASGRCSCDLNIGSGLMPIGSASARDDLPPTPR
ncbi:HNH endonuclease [Streptomyces sp. NPDC017940]|uniref:HNH endonuclease n=1 Tax=Streptomyces sp. NPDC017940 TaxID=3365017 RepID=UPI0037B38720